MDTGALLQLEVQHDVCDHGPASVELHGARQLQRPQLPGPVGDGLRVSPLLGTKRVGKTKETLHLSLDARR